MGGIRTGPPQLRPGRAFAHTTGALCSGSPHRSDSRSPQTPRGARQPGQNHRRACTYPPWCKPFGVSGACSRTRARWPGPRHGTASAGGCAFDCGSVVAERAVPRAPDGAGPGWGR
ncbi:hypothetical protein C6Y14_39550 [Streptomyces dioscori]|uniref:Uncharacterized protein n=1 Tax=Streptomyces dioscori TaxID=2109333 RepID=A0A2P8PV96_9ACTN|nr:hypothetical protein C6Y14_39550 [Streptomyces dioscori]